jgi:hypothetical protein
VFCILRFAPPLPPRGVVLISYSYVWVLHAPWALVLHLLLLATTRAFAYFTVNLIVSISLCSSILPYNLITNRKKFVVEEYI